MFIQSSHNQIRLYIAKFLVPTLEGISLASRSSRCSSRLALLYLLDLKHCAIPILEGDGEVGRFYNILFIQSRHGQIRLYIAKVLVPTLESISLASRRSRSGSRPALLYLLGFKNSTIPILEGHGKVNNILVVLCSHSQITLHIATVFVPSLKGISLASRISRCSSRLALLYLLGLKNCAIPILESNSEVRVWAIRDNTIVEATQIWIAIVDSIVAPPDILKVPIRVSSFGVHLVGCLRVADIVYAAPRIMVHYLYQLFVIVTVKYAVSE